MTSTLRDHVVSKW